MRGINHYSETRIMSSYTVDKWTLYGCVLCGVFAGILVDHVVIACISCGLAVSFLAAIGQCFHDQPAVSEQVIKDAFKAFLMAMFVFGLILGKEYAWIVSTVVTDAIFVLVCSVYVMIITWIAGWLWVTRGRSKPNSNQIAQH
jgi:hypothetical protein